MLGGLPQSAQIPRSLHADDERSVAYMAQPFAAQELRINGYNDPTTPVLPTKSLL